MKIRIISVVMEKQKRLCCWILYGLQKYALDTGWCIIVCQ